VHVSASRAPEEDSGEVCPIGHQHFFFLFNFKKFVPQQTNWPEVLRDDKDFHAFPKISFLKLFKRGIQGSSTAV
jgi:hypothetical protein